MFCGLFRGKSPSKCFTSVGSRNRCLSLLKPRMSINSMNKFSIKRHDDGLVCSSIKSIHERTCHEIASVTSK